MIRRTVAWCARHPWPVLLAMLVAGVGGELARRGLARDVIPDLADPQIGVIADWMGHTAPELSQSVTTLLTRELGEIAGVKAVRGLSMAGMAYVDVVVASAGALDEVHHQVAARIAGLAARLPPNVRTYVGPPASSTGWVLEYALTDPDLVSSQLDLRRFQDEVLRPALAAVPGVAEVASVGGSWQQLRVDVKPGELRERGLAFTDVLATLRPRFAAHQGVTRLAPEAIADLPVTPADPVAATSPPAPPAGDLPHDSPTRLRDVALVRLTDDMPTGLADLAGRRAVGGIVIARRDANLTTMIDEVKRVLARECRRLPHRNADPARLDSGAAADVHVAIAYDRTELATRVRGTLLRALGEEVAVVVLVILVFLVHLRSALVPLVTLPAVLLLTFAAMWLCGVPATLMSLGGIGIALGMAVDADIVALEASHRWLEGLGPKPSPGDRRAKILAATQSLAPAILTSLLITALSFLPVFAFGGETGRLVRPLALTKTLVVVAAAIVTLTVAPALRDRLVGGRLRAELANPLTRGLLRAYRPFVHFALSRPVFTLTTAGLALASCLLIVTRLGGEFMPRIDEGDLFFMPTTLPGPPPEQAAQQLFWQDHAMSRFPEVAGVFGKIGRADTGTDPAPYAMAETVVRLRPRAEWPKVPRARWYSSWVPAFLRPLLAVFWPDETPRTQAELIAELDEAVRLPGWTSAWTAPARARMDMMATGVRTPVGIRVVSPEPRRLVALGTTVRRLIEHVPGTRSAVFEATGEESRLDFAADPRALARFAVDPTSVELASSVIVGGGLVGEMEHEGRRLRVRVAPQVPDVLARGGPDLLRDLTVRSSVATPAAAGGNAPPWASHGQPVPLALLGQPVYRRVPAALRAERGELCAYVHVDLNEGNDVAGYVERARAAVAAATTSGELAFGDGERIEWTGQYELMVTGQHRLRWIIPLLLLSMLLLLYLQFRSLTEALLVLAAVPFALVGSIWTLYLLHYPLSAPVWVGLLSVVGLAMQTGVVMVVYIDEAFHRRVAEGRLRNRADIVAAHAEGTIARLRPKVMTITTMGASLLPLLWARGAGAEVMRRVAAPMLGGLLSSAFLTLEVLPVLYTIWRYRQLRRAQRRAVALTDILGGVRATAPLPAGGDGG